MLVRIECPCSDVDKDDCLTLHLLRDGAPVSEFTMSADYWHGLRDDMGAHSDPPGWKVSDAIVQTSYIEREYKGKREVIEEIRDYVTDGNECMAYCQLLSCLLELLA